MEADFNDAIEAIESLPEDVVATINAASQRWNRRFYFYVVRSVWPSLSKEVDKAAEDAHAEMGGGKDLAGDHNYVVVIAGIGLVEVSEPLVDRVDSDHRLNYETRRESAQVANGNRI